MKENISKHKKIKVVAYNSDWIEQYKNEEKEIKEGLGNNLIAIHHIGSTSIPGLSAKPKIDIIAEVIDPQKSISQLETIGMQYRGEYNIPFHYAFNRRGKINVNLHVYEKNNPEIELNLLFRDYLIKHPNAKIEYGKLKEKILQDESAHIKQNYRFVNYTLRKGDFIRKILKKAGFNQIRMLRCSNDYEWTTAKNFRQKYFFDKVSIKDPYEWTFNDKNHEHFILYKGTEIMGYAHIQLWLDHRAAIRIIVIDEIHRNKNYGTIFMKLIEKWLKEKGYKSLHIQSRSESFNFYSKLGYSKMSFNDPDGYETHPNDIEIGKII